LALVYINEDERVLVIAAGYSCEPAAIFISAEVYPLVVLVLI
jgi:hypothetical protein